MRRLAWSPDLAERLGESLGDDAAEIGERIEAGELLALEWGGELVTVTGTEGAEFVVNCAAGRNLPRYLGQLYRMAQQAGCRTIRFHSDRPGLARVARAYRFRKQGRDDTGRTVYRCRVQYGR